MTAALPALSATELRALGEAGRCPLVDAAEESRWADLDDAGRAAVAAAGAASLRARGLVIDGPGGSPEVRMSAGLAAVVAARSDPAAVLITGQEGRDPVAAPRGYRGRAAAGPDWLVERVEEEEHTFTAVTAPAMVTRLSGWLAGADRHGGASRIAAVLDPAVVLTRWAEVVRPSPGGPSRHRIVVLSTPVALAVRPVDADGRLLPVQPLAGEELRAWVADALAG